MTNPEIVRAARETAENALDGLMRVAREDLDDLPTEGRFEFLLATIAQLNPSPAMLAAVAVVAVEQLLLVESLDEQLSAEGGQLGGPESFE